MADQLCTNCKTIAPILVDILRERRSGWPYPSLQDIGQDPDCSLCRFFKQLKNDNMPYELSLQKSGEVFHTTLEPERFNSFKYTAVEMHPGVKSCRLLALRPLDWRGGWTWRRGYIGLAGSELGVEVESAVTASVQLVPEKVELSMVRGWVQTCRDSHVACGANRGDPFRVMRVIDCETRSVVSMPSAASHEYVTLSYLWGEDSEATQEIQRSASDHGLSQNIPKVIEDAIEVVKGLGFRYLWVDRYCIPDLNQVEKSEQIRNMGRIYADSVVTIIAAAGDDPSYGLPGVGTRERNQQPSVTLESEVLVSTLPHPSIEIRSSQ